jgi:hypothetical protein
VNSLRNTDTPQQDWDILEDWSSPQELAETQYIDVPYGELEDDQIRRVFLGIGQHVVVIEHPSDRIAALRGQDELYKQALKFIVTDKEDLASATSDEIVGIVVKCGV